MLSPLSCLLATVFLVGYASAQVVCRPVIVPESMLGRITATTVSLEVPCCLIQNPLVPSNGFLWTVVSASNAISNFNPSDITAVNIPSFFNFSSNFFYLTLGTPVNTLTCAIPTRGINVLRIGNDINCIFNLGIPDCNGPLNPELAYRFKFVVTNENGTIVAQSEWSAEIFLKRARPFSSIDTQVKHGADMIIITSILPVFLTFIFAFLSAILFSNCCCIKVSSTQVDVPQH